jgi:hypothetical protein
MKMRILHWLYGKKEREKKEKKKQEKEKRERYERMPDFKRIFCSLPNIINAAIFKPRDIETQNVPSVQDRADAKSAAEKKIKAAASKNKVDDVYARIQTTKSRNYEIVWLLQTNEDVPYKSVRELMESYRNVKDSDSIKGISVNYVSEGKLHEISPLNEQDLDGLAKKLEC